MRYRVTQDFNSAGKDGVHLFRAGEMIALDRQARSLTHLELIEGEEKPQDTEEGSDSLAEAEAQAAQEKARAALEAEATQLGISFRVNTSNEKLAERISEAKKA